MIGTGTSSRPRTGGAPLDATPSSRFDEGDGLPPVRWRDDPPAGEEPVAGAPVVADEPTLPAGGEYGEGPQPGPPADEPVRRGPHLPYLGGIDGLRAISVLAVLAYHAGFGWATGGFLGVEVFFVVSGYLITALLLAEGKGNGGRIDLRRFYVRRARRLLPALLLVLAAVAAWAVLFLPDEVATLRGDLVAALTYSTNWFYIVAEKSYFEFAGRPSLLQHLWSLAIEEQFYLLWPLIFAGGMRLLGRRWIVPAIVAGALASTWWMAHLYDPTAGDPSRVYYGTDTRSSALLWGAALAFAWAPWRLRRSAGRGAPLALDLVGTVALVLLVRQFLVVGEFDDGLYRGGFLVTALLSVVVIAVAAHPAARLGTVLGCRPLRWIGLRSYGIYLWHWPIFQLTRPQLDVPFAGPPLWALQFGLTFALAALSYRFVEQPIRHGALGRWWDGVRSGADVEQRRTRRRVALAGVAGVAVVGLLAGAVARADFPETPDYLLAAGPDPAASGVFDPADVLPPTTVAPAPTTTAAPTTTGAVAPDPSAVPVPETTPPPPPPTTLPVPLAARVTALGDSVMLGAAPTLQAGLGTQVFVEAAVGRQVSTGIEILRAWKDLGFVGDGVVVHLGNNGTFSAQQFDEIAALLADVPRVVFVTVKVPRAWEGPVNEVIVNGAQRMPNARLVDWYSASVERPELFWDDGMHLRPEGAQLYTQLVREALA